MAQQTRFECLVEELNSLKNQRQKENVKISFEDVKRIFDNNEIVLTIPEGATTESFENLELEEQDNKIVGFSLKFN